MMDAINGIVGDARQKYVEEQKEMDRLVAEKILSPKQKKIAAVAGDKTKIDADDFAALRSGKKVAEEVEELDEISKQTLGSYIKKASQDSRLDYSMGSNFYNRGFAHRDAGDADKAKTNFRIGNQAYAKSDKRQAGVEKAVNKLTKKSEGTLMPEEVFNEAAERDTPGQHVCAVHVKHSSFGEGRTLFSQHADPDAEGLIEWYDVMFEHGIEKKVPTTDLEILEACSHGNHKKGK